jgi:hypothetical protein
MQPSNGFSVTSSMTLVTAATLSLRAFATRVTCTVAASGEISGSGQSRWL